ncbi:lipid-A-disaccharide synthase [Fluoribacter dumoffii]|uniref:Lipid-A-disaccharide synthase n=1 Tax=Fluoribacter dumoffii TaxID=463 RepID=A0A377GA36_9GAMM|nr:lipid-A-disaccharide synthase [Fluoribacter dumoffii]KTC88973.1 lipid-A-disaccharide synthase [Fluoribacter dumoffii NY 23]MCW8418848.1 lipid-A-disaccharide synthase [Fluoribacter dumoffii]MCW8453308.1 lipid-A-disaccharide synthase [Fluoribacter dumoffii]MCW8459471.1 lipid-A-disaccharide synthase [Fluoribacter dumoffii]MCW8482831.1 lipid-A-disaccharide synthase [Fluoribacter dumoffii]
MQKSKHVVIIAGEESGDVHASVLIRQLKTTYPDIEISGIGGQHMQAAGAQIISDLARFGVTGLTAVIRHLNVIRKAFLAVKKHLNQNKPDLLILVDYPGFNLRLAKYAKQKLGIKILYYISPQIWAWKANRIHLIKKCVDQMAVILPFEKPLYEKAQVPVNFVGHPLVEKITTVETSQSQRAALGLPQEANIFALLPGSRSNEIKYHMPILRDTAHILQQRYPNVHFVIPIADTINPDTIKNYFSSVNVPVSFVQGKAINCMAAADFIIVASGTASLECALLEKPMCIIYKSSFLSYILAMRFIKVKFFGLCNLLANKMIVPEFLQYDCNAHELTRYIDYFYTDPDQPQKMISQLTRIKKSLSSEKSDRSLFSLVVNELLEKNA